MTLRSSLLAPFGVLVLSLAPVAACANRDGARAVGSAAASVERAPVTAAAPVGSADPVGSCRREGARLDADFAAAYAAAPRACRADTDCVLAPVHCSRCGSGAVLASARAAYEAKVRPLEAACGAFAQGACATIDPQPMPSCVAYRAVCRTGTCDAEMRLP